MTDPLIQPDVIPLHASAADPIVLPDASSVFGDRARRFEQLATRELGQAAFFGFMAHLARAQQAALERHPPLALPDPSQLAMRHAHAMPVYPAGLSEHGTEWTVALRAVLDASRDAACDASLPASAIAARRRLEAADDATLVPLGEALLAFDYESVPPDVVPWLAAGVQVHWSAVAVALGREAIRPLDVATVCPCCGSLPVASLRRIDGLSQGMRYLVCSLCATQWHMVRVKCSHCESTAGIGYLTLSSDPDSEAGRKAATRELVKAETCDECSSYLKLVSLEADTQADPVADDLATLALDVLTDERGYARVGPNLFIHPGVAVG